VRKALSPPAMVLHLICESVAAGVVFPEKSQGVAGTGRDGGSAVQLGTSPRPPNYAKGACEQGLQPTFTVQTLPPESPCLQHHRKCIRHDSRWPSVENAGETQKVSMRTEALQGRQWSAQFGEGPAIAELSAHPKLSCRDNSFCWQILRQEVLFW
jgi:hypothetical protein